MINEQLFNFIKENLKFKNVVDEDNKEIPVIDEEKKEDKKDEAIVKLNDVAVNCLVEQLKERSKTEDIVLLDYNLNPDNRDITKPLSHAELVKMYIEGRYPEKEEDFRPYSKEELKEIKKAAKKRPSQKKKIETSEDIFELLNSITEILEVSERSAKDLSELLCIEGGSKTINKYIKRIPNLKVRTQKKTKYYTLMEIEETPSLF